MKLSRAFSTRAAVLAALFAAAVLGATSNPAFAQAMPKKGAAADPKDGKKDGKMEAPPAAPAMAQGLTPEMIGRITAATVYIEVDDGTRGGTGSGFVVKTEGKLTYIVTNDHVANFAEHEAMSRGAESSGTKKANISVVFRSGTTVKPERYKATMVASDPKRDLAVITVKDVKDVPAPIELKAAQKLQVFMPVVISGFGGGDITAVKGQLPVCALTETKIASLPVSFKTGRIERVQVNGSMTHGNSGGPVLSLADGTLVGVASSGVDGTPLAFAIPREEVFDVLAGTHGIIRVKSNNLDGADEGPAQIRVALVDPFRTIKSATAHYRPGSFTLKTPGEKPTLIPGAKKADLTIENGFAVGEIVAPSKGSLVVQMELELAGGPVISIPVEVMISGSGPTPNPGMIEGGTTTTGGKVRVKLPPDGRLIELPAMPFREKPKSSETSTSLSDLSVKPAEFIDKDISVEGLSSLQLAALPDGNYEITLLTEAGNVPSNLRMQLTKDIALQLSEIYADIPGYSYALRLEGKVRKPAGRSDVHPFEVSELHFLNSESKPVTTLKSLAAAPPGPPSLSNVNRFPAEYKGKTVTFDAFVTGLDNSVREIALKVNHASGTPVLNLKFFASKELAKMVEVDVPSEGTLAKLECVVEDVDGRKGFGILGVKSIDILDGAKSKKKLSSSDKITYPISTPVKPPAPEKTASSTPAKAEAEAPSRRGAAEPKAEGSNLLLYIGIGGGVGLFALLIGGFLLLKGGKKDKTAGKYGRKSEPVAKKESPSRPAAKPVAKPTPVPVAKAKPQPTASDNPFDKPAAPAPVAKAKPKPKPADDNPFASFG